MKITAAFVDTRTNNEDFAITPFLFAIYVNEGVKVYGIGVCWGWYSFGIAFGFKLQKDFPSLIIEKFKDNE